MRAPRGRSAAARLAGIVATAALCCAVLLCSAPATVAAAGGCASGRVQLTCGEKLALYYDSVQWAIGGFGALDLFQAPRPLHLRNPALAGFWRFQAAIGITRYEYEFAIINYGVDRAFEQVAPAARLPAPRIEPSGIVTRSMARALSRLLALQQRLVVNLVAMDVALNRATAAQLDSRSDWARYQTYLAAGSARRAAAAIAAAVDDQRAVTRALVRAGLMFGVGPADQRAAQRAVRRHGFPPAVRQIMVALGMDPITLAFARREFLQAKPTQTTYSLSHYLSSGSVIGYGMQAARALRQFANATPPAPVPS